LAHQSRQAPRREVHARPGWPAARGIDPRRVHAVVGKERGCCATPDGPQFRSNSAGAAAITENEKSAMSHVSNHTRRGSARTAISVAPRSGRTGGSLLKGSFGLVVLMSLAAPITALAQSGADVVPVKDQAPVGQTILPQARRDSPDITSHIRFGWPAAGMIFEGFCWHRVH
jgi:hypothetical protein